MLLIQGFNMLGALILQVMDKEEEESMKVMIYLVEGVLPTGYFYGSMGGLQADMGVFRELMQTRLPRLAKHLQRLQGPVDINPSTTIIPGSNNRSPISGSSSFTTMLTRNGGGHGTSPTASASAPSSATPTTSADDEATSDYNQWLHAMKLVARLPGGTPPEFRRKVRFKPVLLL